MTTVIQRAIQTATPVSADSATQASGWRAVVSLGLVVYGLVMMTLHAFRVIGAVQVIEGIKVAPGITYKLIIWVPFTIGLLGLIPEIMFQFVSFARQLRLALKGDK